MIWVSDLLWSLSIPLLAIAALPLVLAWERRNATLDACTRVAASTALFLTWVQAGGMVLGFTGLLHAGFVIAWLTAGLFVCGAFAFRQLDDLRPRFRLAAPTIVGACIAIVYLLQATVPPWYRDSLVYHLALPRAFAMAGGYVRPDDNIFASFPLGWESILAMLHALGPAPDRFPPFNPRLLGVWTTLAAAFATAGLAGTAGASPRAASWAGVLFLLVPTGFEFGASAYVESWLVLLTSLALGFVIRAGRSERGALVPAAIAAGLAASVKYPGVAVCVFLALLLLASGLRRGEEESRRAIRNALSFAAIAGVVGCAFYVRNLVERGNPVFPLAFDVFGGSGWDSWRDLAYGITLSHYGMGREAIDFLLLPFRLFTATSMRTGFEGSVGPIAALGIVAGIGALRRRAGGGQTALLGFAALWFFFWAFSVQQVRFFLVAIPALLALLPLGADRLRSGMKRPATLLIVVIAFAWFAPPAYALWNRQQTDSWLSGRKTGDEILAGLLPDSYPVMRDLEALVPEDGKVWLVWMRGYTYYLRRDHRLDSVFEAYRFEALLDEATDDDNAVARLHADGITHCLIHGSFFLVDGNAELRPGRTEAIKRRFDALVGKGMLRASRTWGPVTLYEVRVRDSAESSEGR